MSESVFPLGAIKLLAEMAIRESQATGKAVALSDLAKDMPREHIALLHYEFLTRSTLFTWVGRFQEHWVVYQSTGIQPWTVEVELVR